MNTEEYTLGECLSACGLRELPPKIGADCNQTWLRAICEVLKVGGRREYCLCENDGHGKPVIKRDFGLCAAIVAVDAIYPFEFADRTIVPAFKSDAEIVHYLSKSKYDKAEIEALLEAGDREEIQRRIHEVALGAQKRKKSEEERVRKMKEMVANKTVKTQKTNGRRKKKID